MNPFFINFNFSIEIYPKQDVANIVLGVHAYTGDTENITCRYDKNFTVAPLQ